ncbi:MAG: hypothetical protein ACYDEJ_00425 [Desulfitobacteriaceae bacterium]
MPRKNRWVFLKYLGRVFILLVLLTLLIPKLAVICNIWISSIIRDEQRPNGNPMRVEIPLWKEFVVHLIPDVDKKH